MRGLERTEAIVLRRTDYGEADRIINLLTPTGRVSAIAKGVRKEKSKLAGGIELFAVSDLTLARGRGDLRTVTSARLITFYKGIMKDVTRLQFGYEAIKQVASASESVDEPEWFDLLRTTFKSLDDLEIDLRITESWFRLQAAILLGTGLNLATDVAGDRLDIEGHYEFEPEEMAFRLRESGTFGAEHIKLLRLMSARDPSVIHNVGGIGTLLDATLYVTRMASAT